MKETPTYVSKATYYTLIPRLLIKHGGTLRMKTLDTMVKEYLEHRFSKQDLQKVKTGFGRIARWKRVMAFAKVDLMKDRLVVQVKGMAIHMQFCKFPLLQKMALQKISRYLLEPSMPPKIKQTIRGQAKHYKVKI